MFADGDYLRRVDDELKTKRLKLIKHANKLTLNPHKFDSALLKSSAKAVGTVLSTSKILSAQYAIVIIHQSS